MSEEFTDVDLLTHDVGCVNQYSTRPDVPPRNREASFSTVERPILGGRQYEHFSAPMVVGLLIIALGLTVAGIETVAGFDVLAAGETAVGYLAAGNFSVGVLSTGIFSVGIFAAGIFSVGIFAIGVFSIGIFSSGIYAAGFYAVRWHIKTPE